MKILLVIKKSGKAYDIYLKYGEVLITYCNLEYMLCRLDKQEILLDIDSDFFIINGLGAFYKDNKKYKLCPNVLEYFLKIKILFEKAKCTIISRSIFGKYIPDKYYHIPCLIKNFLIDYMDKDIIIEIMNVVCSDMIYQNTESIRDENIKKYLDLYNANISLLRGEYRKSEEWFKHSKIVVNIYNYDYLINWEYYMIKNNCVSLRNEFEKIMYWFNDILLYRRAYFIYNIEIKNFNGANDLLNVIEVDSADFESIFYIIKYYYIKRDKTIFFRYLKKF